jgi:late competence protein required for DNA uptake (superfamily II DNA/RNA helicase)
MSAIISERETVKITNQIGHHFMASAEVLKEIVKNGGNLVLTTGISTEVLYELAEIAENSGAKLSISTAFRSDVLVDLARRYGNSITFINGLANFKKE